MRLLVPCGQELGLDGMGSICELSINIVKKNKPKVLRGLTQNGKWSGTGAVGYPVMDVEPPVDREAPNPSCYQI